jgi:hypothetical protein
VGAEERDQRAAEQRADRGRDPDDRAEQAEAVPRSWPRKRLWMAPLICGVISPPAQPCSNRASPTRPEGTSSRPSVKA